MNEKPIILFDDSVKSRIIEALGFTEDDSSRLVNVNGKLVTSQEFESITSDNFGGVLQGSKIPIKKQDSEIVKYFISGKC